MSQIENAALKILTQTPNQQSLLEIAHRIAALMPRFDLGISEVMSDPINGSMGLRAHDVSRQDDDIGTDSNHPFGFSAYTFTLAA